MATVTRTVETENSIITVRFDREVIDSVAYADGWNITTGREIREGFSTSFYSRKAGKIVASSNDRPVHVAAGRNVPAGAVAKLGQAYLSQQVLDLVVAAMAECEAELPKSDEQIALELAAAAREESRKASEAAEVAKAAARNQHPGWCNRCHSYCYGDCQSR